MASKVYFCDAHSKMRGGLLVKLRRLLDAGLAGTVAAGDIVASPPLSPWRH